MSKSNLASKIKPSSSTDWARVKRDVTADVPLTVVKAFEPYDPEDAQAVDAFWDKADLKRGRGRPALAQKRPTLNMRIDADLLEAFKATGPGWKTRIHDILRRSMPKLSKS